MKDKNYSKRTERQENKPVKEFMKNTFTLAEVLIVIGIVGVVAAITIPALINTISPKAKEAQTKTIEARLLDGLNRYNAMEDGLSKPYETTKEFLEGLSKYYKMNAICDSDEITTCVPYAKISYDIGEGDDKIVNSVNVATLTQNSTMMSKKAAQNYLAPASFITAQGTPVVIAFKRNCIWDNGTAMKDIRDSGCIALMYDKNGVNLPNKMGDDIESIGLSVAVAGLRTINGVKVMEKAFFPQKSLTKAECSAEIPKQSEYIAQGFTTGIGHCKYNDDTWAYAMKYCFDKGYHLPSENESLKLAKGLRNSDNSINTQLAKIINLKNSDGTDLSTSNVNIQFHVGRENGIQGKGQYFYVITTNIQYNGTNNSRNSRYEYQIICTD